MEKTYKVFVLNTTTEQFEEVELSKEIYDEYRRGEWRIQKNEKKKSRNETPFSSLIGYRATARINCTPLPHKSGITRTMNEVIRNTN